jgi:hypothetical protein
MLSAHKTTLTFSCQTHLAHAALIFARLSSLSVCIRKRTKSAGLYLCVRTNVSKEGGVSARNDHVHNMAVCTVAEVEHRMCTEGQGSHARQWKFTSSAYADAHVDSVRGTGRHVLRWAVEVQSPKVLRHGLGVAGVHDLPLGHQNHLQCVCVCVCGGGGG